MAVYVAMLRGINVGGHKLVKMDVLRKMFEDLGFEGVKTFIQSGNVVFRAPKMSPLALCSRIEKQIVEKCGFAAPVICRTADELSEVIRSNPFLKERGLQWDRLHVMFLSNALSAAALRNLDAFAIPPDQARCRGNVIYLYLPNGVSGSKLMKAPLDRQLQVLTTTRNWKTVNALQRMCEECG
jgi:uncharacterized protein (DUF1697 family)